MKNILMDKYNLIILVLIIILALLFLYISKQKDGFSSSVSENDMFGNILYYCNSSCTNKKLFKKQYRITGFHVKANGSYKLKINNSYVSINDNLELTSNKYYDINDLNIKSKEIVIEPVNGGTASAIKIYGLNDYNIMNKSNYDAAAPIANFTISNDDNKTITFGNNLEYLVSYMEFPASTASTNIEVEYKNQFTSTTSGFDKLSSGITDLANKFHSGSTKIYFTKPILASQIKLTGHSGFTASNSSEVKLYGKQATESDVNTYKMESEIDNEENSVVLDGQKCPAMKDIITRQKLINDLCNSISEKDKIRNQQTNFEKTKKYIGKLKQQENQIQALKMKLTTLLKDNENTSLSFQEKVASIQNMINEVNTNNPFNKVDVNYTDTPVITNSVTTTSTTNSTSS